MREMLDINVDAQTLPRIEELIREEEDVLNKTQPDEGSSNEIQISLHSIIQAASLDIKEKAQIRKYGPIEENKKEEENLSKNI